MRTVFLGDSLTEGIPGVSYWRFLRGKSLLYNRGRGGDTLLGASGRLDKMLNSNRYADIQRYVLEIGTNDVLLPVLEAHSFLWRVVISAKGKILGCVPCDNMDTFRRKYEELILKLLAHDKKIIVIGLPLIENSVLTINQIMDKYNSVLIELCVRYNIPYIDIRKLESEIKGTNGGSYFFGKTTFGSMTDAILTTILPFSMFVSRIRGLAVTIDSVHLNRYTAQKLALAVEKKLEDIPAD